MQLAIMGGGVMGEIMTAALLKHNLFSSDAITIIERNAVKREHLRKKYGVLAAASADKVLPHIEILILAIKPQNVAESLHACQAKLPKDALVISIMAGIQIKTLQDILQHKAIVRAMPNTPAKIGDGMTAWVASSAVSGVQKIVAKAVFQTFGCDLKVDSETMIDAATAVSGSGPAYIFYFAEKLIEAAMSLGFNSTDATRLIHQTFEGAMHLWVAENKSPKKLREMVTSKNGTTEAAITMFNQLNTGENFQEAVHAAFQRAQELGGTGPLTKDSDKTKK